MLKGLLLTCLLILIVTCKGNGRPSDDEEPKKSFVIDYERDCYSKDGECYRYIAGEMHYFRIPPDLWLDRLTKLKSAGFDTLQTYIPWNVHVPEENGDVTFTGIADIFRYIEYAQNLGLYVIVRPGPFLATEWDYGGFPGWLLHDRPTLEVRRNETVYMHEVRKWYQKLLPNLVPYLYSNGGPIIAVQVENEFGSNKPCDAAHYDYLYQLRDIYRHHLGEDVVLLTVDGDSHTLAKCGNIVGLYSTVNFGAGGRAAEKFAVQRKQEPRGPYVCSAFFSGWLDHWGHQFNKVATATVAESLKDILEFNNRTASVSMYMFHGGTNFGYMQGAKGMYQTGIPEYPEIWGKMTSYDYDAPLSEAGDTTWKYWQLREIISNYSKVYEVPVNSTKQNVGPVRMTPVMHLYTLLKVWPEEYKVKSKYPRAMEEMGQNHGLVVYHTKIPNNITLPAKDLIIDLYGDRVYVFSQKDGTVQMSSRNRSPRTFCVDARDIYILTEDNGHSNTGHIRYPYFMYQKGIIGNVSLSNQNLTDWEAYLISETLPNEPFTRNSHHLKSLLHRAKHILKHTSYHDQQEDQSSYIHSDRTHKSGNHYPGTSHTQEKNKFIPTLYATSLVKGITGDTFIDTSGWGKGLIFVNGFNLGRYWPLAGPQMRLYCPKSWCSSGGNGGTLILMLELEHAPRNQSINIVDTPLLDAAYDLSQL